MILLNVLKLLFELLAKNLSEIKTISLTTALNTYTLYTTLYYNIKLNKNIEKSIIF